MPGLNTWGLNSPAMGGASSGYAPLGPSYGLQEALELAGSTCIIGTDNGFIIKRDAPNHFKVVYADEYDPTSNSTNIYVPGPDQQAGAHGYRSLQCEHVDVAWNNPNHIIMHVEDEFASDWGGYVYSDDAGETWQRSHPGGPYPPIFYTFADSLGSEGQLMDEDGYLWAYSVTEFIIPKDDWHKAIEGDTWVRQFAGDNASGATRTHWLGDGNIWGIQLNQNLAASLTLTRQAITGGAVSTELTIAKPGGASFTTVHCMWGRHGTSRLVGWPSVFAQTAVQPWPVLSIDITDPFNPTSQWSANNVLGVGYNVMMMLPLTHDIVVANTLKSSDGADGALWRSADGGITWTKVVAETSRLSLQPPSSAFGTTKLLEDNERIASPPEMPWEVWAATKPPFVYHSRDGGLSWEAESVNMDIFNGYAGRTPTVWNSIGALPGQEVGPDLVTTA